MLYYILGKQIEKQLETIVWKKRFLSKIGMKHIQSNMWPSKETLQYGHIRQVVAKYRFN